MTPRPPVVAGAVRGSGATTLAVALRGHDAGSLDGPFTGRADLLVCRGDEAGLRAAAAVAVAGRARPVLAVVPAGPVPRERLRALEHRFGAVVVLPHLARWEGAPTPVAEAAAVLARPGEQLPRELRELAAELHRLVHALLTTGVLAQGAPPFVTRAVGPARGRYPVPVRRGPVASAPRADGRSRPDATAGAPRRPVPPLVPPPDGAGRDDAASRGRARGDGAPDGPVASGAAPGTAGLDSTAPDGTAGDRPAPDSPTGSSTAPRGATPHRTAPVGAAPTSRAPDAAAPTNAASTGTAPGSAAPRGVARHSAAPGGAAPRGTAPAVGAPTTVPTVPTTSSPDLDDDAIEALVLAAVG